jgi:hypothetical protein
MRSHQLLLIAFAVCGSIGMGEAYADKFCDMAEQAGERSDSNYFLFIDPTIGSAKEIKSNLYQGLREMYKELDAFDRVIVKRVNSDSSVGQTVFDRCLPACPDPSVWDKFGIGSCNTIQTKKGKQDFRKSLLRRSISLLSSTESSQSADLIDTFRTAARVAPAGAKVIMFSDLQHSVSESTPVTSDDYDQLFFDVVQGEGVPDLDARSLSVFGYGAGSESDPAAVAIRREFWDQFFLLSRFNQVLIAPIYQ